MSNFLLIFWRQKAIPFLLRPKPEALSQILRPFSSLVICFPVVSLFLKQRVLVKHFKPKCSNHHLLILDNAISSWNVQMIMCKKDSIGTDICDTSIISPFTYFHFLLCNFCSAIFALLLYIAKVACGLVATIGASLILHNSGKMS